ncbi:MAG: DUF763 domain-containing protein [Caldiserica bacterium]|nr:DUF763 domain-containing protein [Caldisericota bacterium]
MRTGVANLPLHYGRAPSWLFEKMVRLSREVIYLLVQERGRGEFLKKISDPVWFQAFGCALGFDWHSSGLTTTVCGAIKESLKDIGKELGVFAAGGKGKTALSTPKQINSIGERFALSCACEELVQASRITAKVDNSCLQDGFQLYHHTFLFTREGDWCVIQQGMNPGRGWARRYHWLSKKNIDFVNEPHQGIISSWKGEIFNLVAEESDGARETITSLLQEDPERLMKDFKKIREFTLPSHHHIEGIWVDEKKLQKVILRVHAKNPSDFTQVISIKGMGAKSLRALALISELIYGEKVSRRDPARYSFAHGGKDGYPYPVDKKTYEESIYFLREAVSKAKAGRKEKLEAFRQLSMVRERF